MLILILFGILNMSIAELLATISQTEAGMALFSAGLGGVSIMVSNLYGGAKTRLERKRTAKLQDQFDGLLDSVGGQRVSAIRSSLLMIKTFDTFADSVSKGERKQVSLVSAGGGAVLVFLGLIVRGPSPTEDGGGSDGQSWTPLVLKTADAWLQSDVVLPLLAIALVFVLLTQVSGGLYLWFSGRVREQLDVFLPADVDPANDFLSDLRKLKKDKMSYKQAKIDVECRLMASMIEVMESESVRSRLAPKRFVGAAPKNPEEPSEWEERASKIVDQFPALDEVRAHLADIEKKMHGRTDGQSTFGIATKRAFHKLYFDSDGMFAWSETLLREDVMAPIEEFERKSLWKRGWLKLTGRAPSSEDRKRLEQQRINLDLRPGQAKDAAVPETEASRETLKKAGAPRSSGLDTRE
ncbi:hypothetical protein [uncultured Roseobacter sp.]|uniref:hypothetical protein n=1 Tax=uncultured Roseobacter sp. TaxID=114847 RepID=UPI0026272858|nr:hypothetical protein [uncultured Roseobacter sp.]